MKILLITGSFPPDVCGTAEYTLRLSESLNRTGIATEIFHEKQWGLAQLPSLLRDIDTIKPDLIHMQYPTTGYGHALGPQGIALFRPLIVTLHEASQSHVLRQASLYPFLLRSRHFIFNNRYEQRHVTRIAPWIAGKSSVIPIGSNICLAHNRVKQPATLTCFGIVRPEKGLEDVLEATALLRKRGCEVRVRIVGALMPKWEGYYERLRSRAAGLSIEWHIGLDNQLLSAMLAESTLAYLPFPDGASERRSSLIAMLMNQSCVLTTIGPHTPADMLNCVIPVQSPLEAADRIERLLGNHSEVSRFGELGAAYAKRFDWDTIAQQHKEIYQHCSR